MLGSAGFLRAEFFYEQDILVAQTLQRAVLEAETHLTWAAMS